MYSRYQASNRSILGSSERGTRYLVAVSIGKANEFCGFQDLNRDFPSFYDKQRLEKDGNVRKIYEDRQHETKLLMDWILKYPFVLSANFHDGAVLANVSSRIRLS